MVKYTGIISTSLYYHHIGMALHLKIVGFSFDHICSAGGWSELSESGYFSRSCWGAKMSTSSLHIILLVQWAIILPLTFFNLFLILFLSCCFGTTHGAQGLLLVLWSEITLGSSWRNNMWGWRDSNLGDYFSVLPILSCYLICLLYCFIYKLSLQIKSSIGKLILQT